MIVLAMIYNMSEVVLGFFAGDDSLLYSLADFADRTLFMAQMYNLEAKVLGYELGYFWSKFLLYDEDRFYFVPDPVKLVSKLGRKDLKNYEHVEDYRISLMDLTSIYNNPVVSELLTDAVNECYGGKMDLSVVISALLQLIGDTNEFKTLYNLPKIK